MKLTSGQEPKKERIYIIFQFVIIIDFLALFYEHYLL